jgi:hypothetical protein
LSIVTHIGTHLLEKEKKRYFRHENKKKVLKYL